jgi:hypothetical protein
MLFLKESQVEFIPNEFQDSGKIEIVSDHGIKAKKAVFHSPYSIDK